MGHHRTGFQLWDEKQFFDETIVMGFGFVDAVNDNIEVSNVSLIRISFVFFANTVLYFSVFWIIS